MDLENPAVRVPSQQGSSSCSKMIPSGRFCAAAGTTPVANYREVRQLKKNSLLGPSFSTLEKTGAQDVSKVVHKHQWWRLITCMWLHGGVFHLLGNMLGLLVIGIRPEQEFGFVWIGLLYLISGLSGNLLSSLFIQSGIGVGASGALFGLLGGMLSELITNWTIHANKVSALLILVVDIAINLAVGMLPHVDNFAHIGGCLDTCFFPCHLVLCYITLLT